VLFRSTTPHKEGGFGVSKPIHDYILSKCVKPDVVLEKCRRETKELGSVSGMQTSADEGQFLSLIAKTLNAKKIVEVGVFTGYSSLCLASALPPASEGGKLVAFDINEEYTNKAKKYHEEAGTLDRFDLRLGSGMEGLDKLISEPSEEGTYDMAFIDADKTSYLGYYERCLRLLRHGGLVVIDNVLWHGLVLDEEKQDKDTVAIREVNNFVSNDSRVDSVMLVISDGVTLCRKK